MGEGGDKKNTVNTGQLTLLVRDNGLGSTETTSTPGSDETNLLTRRVVPGGGRGMTNVLMVTSSVRVINGIHSNTSDAWPLVTLGPVFEEGTTSLQERLLNTTSSSNDSNHGTAV